MESDYKDIIRDLLRNGNKGARTKIIKKLDPNDDLLKEIYSDIEHNNREDIILNNKKLTKENIREILDSNINASKFNSRLAKVSIEIINDYRLFEEDIYFTLKIIDRILVNIEKGSINIDFHINILDKIIIKLNESKFFSDNIEKISIDYPSFYNKLLHEMKIPIKISKVFIDKLNTNINVDKYYLQIIDTIEEKILIENIKEPNIKKLINAINYTDKYNYIMKKISKKILTLSIYYNIDEDKIKLAKENLIKENFK